VTYSDGSQQIVVNYKCITQNIPDSSDFSRFLFDPGLGDARKVIDRRLREIVRTGQRFICGALSKLPKGWSLSLGADAQAYGGMGGYIGASASVDRNGNTAFNMSRGLGAGLGANVGAGLSINTSTPAPGRTPISHVQFGAGVGYIGASGSYSKKEGGSGSAGASAGPRLGYAVGSVDGVSETTAGGNICK
jgi:hypothetical protein